MQIREKLKTGEAHQFTGNLDEFLRVLNYPSYVIEVYNTSYYIYIDGDYYNPGDWAIKKSDQNHWHKRTDEEFKTEFEVI